MPEQAHTDDGDEQDDDSVSDRLDEAFDRVGHLDDLAYDVNDAVRAADEEGQDAYDAVEGLHETARTISHALNDEAAYAQEAQDLIDRMGEEIQAIDVALAAIEEEVAEQGGDPPLGSEATDFDLVKTAQLLLHEAMAVNEEAGNEVAAARFETAESAVGTALSRTFVGRGATDEDLMAARRGAQRALDGTEVVTWPRLGADPDDEILIVVNTDVPEGADVFDGHGHHVHGETVVFEERVTGDDAACEGCGDTDGPLYRLDGDIHGIPVCLDCLRDYRWTERIVTSKEELADG